MPQPLEGRQSHRVVKRATFGADHDVVTYVEELLALVGWDLEAGERLVAATPVVVAPGADRGYTTGERKALALASLAFGIALYWRRKPGGPELKDAGEFFLGVTTDRVLLWTVGVRGAQPTLTQEAPRSSVRSAELRSFEERRGRALTIMVSFRDRSGWALAVARGHADDASQVVENLMAHTPGEA